MLRRGLRKEVRHLKINSFETTDIFRGAFLLCSGGDLTGVRVRSNGKRIATFLIAGENLAELDRDYRTGRALVNPVQLRESLNHLRDVMFQKLREYDPASRKRYAAIEGRTRYGDRKRGDRGHQT
jgi:hypothetical protein